jgi:hypothetical protein
LALTSRDKEAFEFSLATHFREIGEANDHVRRKGLDHSIRRAAIRKVLVIR